MNEFFELFPVAIKKVQLSLTVPNLNEVVHYIDQELLENNSLIKNGFRSKTNTFLDRKLWLKQILQTEVDTFINEIGLIPAEISYSWCNKYLNKGIITPHKHEMSIVSGVYYPLIKGTDSFLKIKNPCVPFKINEIAAKTTKLNLQEFAIPLEDNVLILFPSWVDHYSDNSAEIKYAVSFDTEIAK
jgi:hypothetical protein